MTIVELPSELAASIIYDLSVRDILRCTRVCKFFRDSIAASPILQYLILLGCSGFVDSGQSTLSIPEKMRKLTNLKKWWRQLVFTEDTTEPFRIDELLAFAGGVLFSAAKIPPARSKAIGLASALFDNSPAQWSFPSLGLRMHLLAVGVDPSSDLMVLVEERERTLGTKPPYQVHLRTLSSNKAHPEAVLPILLRPPFTYWYDHSCDVHIFEDILAIMFASCISHEQADDSAGELVVCNWKTGMELGRVTGRFPHQTTVSFITPKAFMIPCVSVADELRGKSRMVANLEIYGIGPSSSPRCSHLATFQLPPFSRKVVRMKLKSQSAPGSWLPDNHNPTTSAPSPFYIDPLKRVFVVSLHVYVSGKKWDHQANKAFTIFVHSDAFFKLLGEDVLATGRPPPGSEPRIFPWTSWSRYARMTTIEPPNPFRYQTYGEKFVEHERGRDCSRLHVWDFNPYSVWKRDEPKMLTRYERIKRILRRVKSDMHEDPSSGDSTEVVYVTEPTTLMDNDVLKYGKFSSGLPYRRVTHPRTFPAFSDVMMDEERLVCWTIQQGTMERVATVMTVNDCQVLK